MMFFHFSNFLRSRWFEAIINPSIFIEALILDATGVKKYMTVIDQFTTWEPTLIHVNMSMVHCVSTPFKTIPQSCAMPRLKEDSELTRKMASMSSPVFSFKTQ